MLSILMAMALATGTGTASSIWGDVGFGTYPGRSYKVAPNGLTYKPMFRIVADLNVGRKDFYVFAKSAYYAEKPNPGVTTNKSQGQFDFTKRQYDFDLGVAYGYLGNNELRFWAYSQSNINRGNDLKEPYGFKDGAVIANRYYLTDNFALGHLEGGYYLTKELADNNGEAYKPGFFGEANIAIPTGMGFHGFVGGRAIFEKRSTLRQFNSSFGVKHFFAGSGGKTNLAFYFERDFGFRQTAELNRMLLEYRTSFAGN